MRLAVGASLLCWLFSIAALSRADLSAPIDSEIRDISGFSRSSARRGLPGSPWSRNLFSALRFESEASTLPGLRWALEDGDRKQFEKQKSAYAKALKNARDLTRSLADERRIAAAATWSR
jgi:hypothetical protein